LAPEEGFHKVDIKFIIFCNLSTIGRFDERHKV